MKIGIDGNEILHGERAIRRYTVQLISALSRIGEGHQYEILYFKFRKSAHPPLQFDHPRNQMTSRTIWFPGSLIEIFWEKLSWPPVRVLIRGVELFHAPGLQIPPGGGIPLVMTVHSMHHVRIPDLVDPGYQKWYEAFMSRCVSLVDYFITVSESMRQDFLKTYAISPDRVRAIPLGVSPEFQPGHDDEAKKKVKARFGIDRPFLLYVGGIQKHKNVQTILKMFAVVIRKYQGELCLVLAGDHPQGADEILDLIGTLGIKNRVFVTGYLQQESEDLANLYAAAEVFIFPTYWEGWSSPPLEAMASGLPVIASDIAPHRENLGDAALLIHPDDCDGMAEMAVRLLSDRNFKEEYRQRGLEHVKQYTWERMAQSTVNFYQDILKRS